MKIVAEHVVIDGLEIRVIYEARLPIMEGGSHGRYLINYSFYFIKTGLTTMIEVSREDFELLKSRTEEIYRERVK